MKKTVSIPIKRESNVEFTHLPVNNRGRILTPNSNLAIKPSQKLQDDITETPLSLHVCYFLLTLAAGFCIALIMYVLILILLYA